MKFIMVSYLSIYNILSEFSLQKPGKRTMGSSGWVMQDQLEMYFWSDMRNFMMFTMVS